MKSKIPPLEFYRKVYISSFFYLTAIMKIIILIALLLFAHRVERLYAGQFYIALSHLSHQIRLINQSQNKPCIAKKLDNYLNKADSTVAGLRDFQRRYFCIEDQSKQLLKRYCPSTQHYPLIKCVEYSISQLFNGVYPGINKPRTNR